MTTSKKIEYYVPVEEYVRSDDNSVTIKGTAINECTTRNGMTYTAEELQIAAPSLSEKPILKDHNNSVDSIVGKTTSSSYDMMNKKVKFEGVIKDAKMCQMISDGLINNVSIGAMVNEIVKGENGSFTAKGIEFVELSLVAVPADKNAGFAKAIAESYEMNKPIQTGGIKMEEQQVQIKLDEKSRVLEEQNASLLKELEQFKEKEMNTIRETYKALTAEKGVSAKEGYEKLSREILEAMIDTLKGIKAFEKKEIKNETKGQVSESKEEEQSNLRVEKSAGRGYSLYAADLGKLNSRYARN